MSVRTTVRPMINRDETLSREQSRQLERALDLIRVAFSVFRADHKAVRVPTANLSQARLDLIELSKDESIPPITRYGAVSLVRRVENIAKRKGLELKKEREDPKVETAPPAFKDLLDAWMTRKRISYKALVEKSNFTETGIKSFRRGASIPANIGGVLRLADALELTGNDRILFFKSLGYKEELAII